MLLIADNAALILPLHGDLDRAREAARGDSKIGTTGRGIGPAYEDKVGRRAIRVVRPRRSARRWRPSWTSCCCTTTRCCAGLGADPSTKQALLDRLLELAPQILPYAKPVWQRLDEARRAGKRILFEGAQAVHARCRSRHLSRSSPRSNTVAGHGGGRLRRRAGGRRLCARHRQGLHAPASATARSRPSCTTRSATLLGERGHEFGTVTGRRRRCGWFDAVLVRQAVKVAGIEGIALTKLDVLDGLPELKICVGYRIDGETLRHLPAGAAARRPRPSPIYETMEGWSGSTRGARSWADLPAEAVKYVRRIEELIGGAGGAAVHQPGTRRHDPDAGPVRGLIPNGVSIDFFRPPLPQGEGGRKQFRVCTSFP